MKRLLDDCFLHDKDRIKHHEAIDLLKNRMQVIVDTETIAISDATSRILSTPIAAPRPIPAFDNSAVDGFAFAHADHEPTGGYFPVSMRIAAGDRIGEELPGFSAARIFTGAQMPNGADTIAMQEDCVLHEQDGQSFVVVPSGLKRGANCRKAGEDVNSGDVVADTHSMLRPQDIAAIASTGSSTIEAFKPLKIGLLSSGEEILRPGEPWESGKVYDANHHMLTSFLDEGWCEVADLGVYPDDQERVQAQLQEASKKYDVILSTGGASRGEEDHFVAALETLGSCQMWQIAVKPGRPLAFGQIGSTPCFTLPGNPVAAFACFLLYVRPALKVLAGSQWVDPIRFQVPCGFSITSKPDRREFLRGWIEFDQGGKMLVQKFQRDGSGLISGLQHATGLIEVPEEVTEVQAGDSVSFLPFSGLMS